LFFNGDIQLDLPHIVKLIIDAGAYVNDRSADGFTPLNTLMKQVTEFIWLYIVLLRIIFVLYSLNLDVGY